MKEVIIRDKKFVLYIANDKLQLAIKKIALEIKEKYSGTDALFVGIMSGSFMFVSDLFNYIDESFDIDFARYSSYEGLSSTMTLKEIAPLQVDIKDRTVIIVEDLVDTGFTLKCLKDKYLSEGAKEVVIVTMLRKPDAIKCDIDIDYVAMDIENKFIVGHGLDYDHYGRTLRDIYQLSE